MSVRNFSRQFFLVIALCCIAIALPSTMRAQAFEGEIFMQMSSPMMGTQKMDIVFTIKGDKLLQTADDPQSGKMTVYTDNKAGTQIIVQQAQKHGMQIDQSTIDSMIKSMKLPMLVPKSTGKKEKISGYDCEEFTMMIDSSQEMDLWLTKDLPKNVSQGIKTCTEAGMKSTGMRSDALMALLDKGYAQVRMEVKSNGVTQLTNQFVKAEPKKIADAVFVIPSDIKVTKFDPNNPSGSGAGGQ